MEKRARSQKTERVARKEGTEKKEFTPKAQTERCKNRYRTPSDN